jgi:hypothetical protein
MTFTPLVKDGPFETLGYYDLWERMVQGQIAPGDPLANLTEEEAAASAELQRIRDRQAEIIAGGLWQGSLPAYVFVEGEGHFYRVPRTHWNGTMMEGQPGQSLFCWPGSDAPAKLEGLPLLFFVDEVDDWLNKLRVGTDQEAFRDRHRFEDCYARATTPRMGYWAAWDVLAWIASRDERFVAATQLYTAEGYADYGGPHSFTAWTTLDAISGERYGCTFTDAREQLRTELEAGRLLGGAARKSRTDEFVMLGVVHWLSWERSFENDGLHLVPGYTDFRWPAAAVIDAFPRRCGGSNVNHGSCGGFQTGRLEERLHPTAAKRSPLAKRSGPPDEPWVAPMKNLFAKHHDRLTPLSETERLEFIRAHLPPSSKKPASSRALAKHWQRHLDRRARD